MVLLEAYRGFGDYYYYYYYYYYCYYYYYYPPHGRHLDDGAGASPPSTGARTCPPHTHYDLSRGPANSSMPPSPQWTLDLRNASADRRAATSHRRLPARLPRVWTLLLLVRQTLSTVSTPTPPGHKCTHTFPTLR